MRRRNDKTPFHRAQDFAAAIGLTFLIIGLVIGFLLARFANFGAMP